MGESKLRRLARSSSSWLLPLADFGIALALALLTLASRWPYRARMLYNWDAVQFALALTEFDVAKHQPHPPGYLLYVGLGRLANRWVGDPALAYVGLAMLFSAATTFIVYWLARRLYDRTTAIAAAALLAVSPLFWFYGSVGLTYAGEAFGASLVAWWAWGALEGRARYLYLGALTLGLVGGMRQSVLVLIFPLWLGAAVLGVRSWRRVAAAGGVLAAAVLAWLLPTIWLSGGLAAYVAASTQLYGSVVLPTSVLGGSLNVTFAQARYLAESVVVGLGPLALACRRAARVRAPGGVGPPGVVSPRLDPAARRLLHAGALRTGGLCADLPARAGDSARARPGGGGRGRLRAAAPAELALGVDRRGPGGARARQYRASSPGPVRSRASSTTGPAIPGSGGPATRSTTGS